MINLYGLENKLLLFSRKKRESEVLLKRKKRTSKNYLMHPMSLTTCELHTYTFSLEIRNEFAIQKS